MITKKPTNKEIIKIAADYLCHLLSVSRNEVSLEELYFKNGKWYVTLSYYEKRRDQQNMNTLIPNISPYVDFIKRYKVVVLNTSGEFQKLKIYEYEAALQN